jgi:hypothetical protein
MNSLRLSGGPERNVADPDRPLALGGCRSLLLLRLLARVSLGLVAGVLVVLADRLARALQRGVATLGTLAGGTDLGLGHWCLGSQINLEQVGVVALVLGAALLRAGLGGGLGRGLGGGSAAGAAAASAAAFLAALRAARAASCSAVLPDLRDFVLSSAIVLAVSVSCDED